MTLQEILNEIEKQETEIIKPHLDNILYIAEYLSETVKKLKGNS